MAVLTFCILQGEAVLAQSKLFHDFLELGVEVGSQTAVNLRLYLLVASLREEVLLVQHADLVVDFSDVLELVGVDAFGGRSTESLPVTAIVALVIRLVREQTDFKQFDVLFRLLLLVLLFTSPPRGAFLLSVVPPVLTASARVILLLVLNPLRDFSLMV